MRYPLSSLALFPRLLRARPVQFRPTRTSLRLRHLHTSEIYHYELRTQTYNEKKTVYALSTPPGRAGIAIIRISGPNALDVYHSMVITSSNTQPELKFKRRVLVPKPWHLERCSIRDVQTQETLDDGMAVFFKGIPTILNSIRPSSPNLMSLLLFTGPKSFTSEDVVELHIHSSRAVISSVLRSLSCIPGCRPAERGEFTRRAFQAGRMDLTQVEALGDLIDAETNEQRRLARMGVEVPVISLGGRGGILKELYSPGRVELVNGSKISGIESLSV